jgi:hypothetical protein
VYETRSFSSRLLTLCSGHSSQFSLAAHPSLLRAPLSRLAPTSGGTSTDALRRARTYLMQRLWCPPSPRASAWWRRRDGQHLCSDRRRAARSRTPVFSGRNSLLPVSPNRGHGRHARDCLLSHRRREAICAASCRPRRSSARLADFSRHLVQSLVHSSRASPPHAPSHRATVRPRTRPCVYPALSPVL